MCALLDGVPDVEILASNAAAVAVLDRFASRRGHVLVVLRRHEESQLDWEEYVGVQRLAWEASHALGRVLGPRRVYVAALGSKEQRTTSFPHHHVHVVPLADGGEPDRPARVFTWEHGVYLYEPGEAAVLAEALRSDWPSEVFAIGR
jgi:diadenosine tetraphosphate (Ap4A) HIT family hydrolase